MWVPWHIEEGHDTQEAPGIYQEQGPTSRGIHSYWVVITLIVIYDDLCQANVFLQFMVLDFWSKWWELVVLGNIGGEVRSFQNLCLLLDPMLQASSTHMYMFAWSSMFCIVFNPLVLPHFDSLAGWCGWDQPKGWRETEEAGSKGQI